MQSTVSPDPTQEATNSDVASPVVHALLRGHQLPGAKTPRSLLSPFPTVPRKRVLLTELESALAARRRTDLPAANLLARETGCTRSPCYSGKDRRKAGSHVYRLVLHPARRGGGTRRHTVGGSVTAPTLVKVKQTQLETWSEVWRDHGVAVAYTALRARLRGRSGPKIFTYTNTPIRKHIHAS